MSIFGDEPICTCEDTMWHIECYVGGRLVDEALVDITSPSAMRVVDDIREKHDMLTNLAIAGGQSWRVKMACPHCKKGMQVDSEEGPEVLNGDN